MHLSLHHLKVAVLLQLQQPEAEEAPVAEVLRQLGALGPEVVALRQQGELRDRQLVHREA